MTPVERLQAAIDRLEHLKVETTVDAQLEVLRSAADFITQAGVFKDRPALQDSLAGLLREELALADVILGGAA